MDLDIIGRSSGSCSGKVKAKWHPPDEGFLKINVDASFLLQCSEGATGLVIRDSAGVLVRGRAIWYGQVANTLIIEALAVRDGIILACDLGLSNILLETDAKEVVNLWRGREQG